MNNLFFADDCLLFIKAELRQLGDLKRLLEWYEDVGGQRVNLTKSEFTCSPNIDNYMIRVFAAFLGMKQVASHSKYLGLPLVVGQNKVETFRGIEEKLEKRVQDWRNLILSWAGRETLIKACLQSIPLFAMSCFKLPKSLFKNMTDQIIRFWWSGGNTNKSVHWVNKEILMREKTQGGMGFRCFESINDAMLMKQLWRVLRYPELLVSTVLRRKYFKDGDPCSYKSKPTGSCVWKSICSVMEMFKSGLVVGQDGAGWSWKFSSSGIYSVKSGYALAHRWNLSKGSCIGEGSNWEWQAKCWTRFWKIRLPDRIKITAWKVYYEALPVFDNLMKRGCDEHRGCIFCGFRNETVRHLFLDCWWAKCFWNMLGLEEWPEEVSKFPGDWLWFVLNERDSSVILRVMVGLWVLWNNRNLVAHQKQWWTVKQCCYRVSSLIAQFESKQLVGMMTLENGIGEEGREEDFVICCDGAWSSYQKVGGYAAVAVKGNFIMGSVAGFLNLCNPGMNAELYGIVAGLKLAEKMRSRSALICSDSMESIWAIQCGFKEPNETAGLLEEGLKLLRDNPGWSLSHVFRVRNGVADFLAKRAKTGKWCWDRNAVPYLPPGLFGPIT